MTIFLEKSQLCPFYRLPKLRLRQMDEPKVTSLQARGTKLEGRSLLNVTLVSVGRVPAQLPHQLREQAHRRTVMNQRSMLSARPLPPGTHHCLRLICPAGALC